MVEATNAIFSFQNFKVTKFSYDETYHADNNLRIGFNPQGKYIKETGVFELTLNVITHDKDDTAKRVFELTSIGFFKFENKVPFNEIPQFFYRNAIAIMFPYIRAFISTLTLQANTKLLRLNLMNLEGLEKNLVDSSVEA